MMTLDTYATQLKKAHSELKSWRKVGDCIGLNPAMTRLIANGYEPGSEIREKLGLSPISTVVVITGNHLPPETQVADARTCLKCGRPFVGNTATRKFCFICSPIRKRTNGK
jgi:hypothetical protein